jgi:hypothetical protein
LTPSPIKQLVWEDRVYRFDRLLGAFSVSGDVFSVVLEVQDVSGVRGHLEIEGVRNWLKFRLHGQFGLAILLSDAILK